MTSDEIQRKLNIGKLPGPLLNRLIDAYRTPVDPDVVVAAGYGRDAAAISPPDGSHLIVKSDPITFTSTDAARYLLAVNTNDVACMGGIPRWLTVVALLPAGTTGEKVEELFADLQAACMEHGVSLVGGHTEVTPAVNQIVLVGTIIGVAGPHGLLAPGMASVGDDLLLTQFAGIEGTALLAHEHAATLSDVLGTTVVDKAIRLLRSPGIGVTHDANALLAVDGLVALHDPTEGGVATAIHELANASCCGSEILADAIPFLPETRVIAAYFGLDPLGLLSSGALLVAVRPGSTAAMLRAASEARIPITRIGRLTDSAQGVTMLTSCGREPLPMFDADEVTRVSGQE